MSKTYKTIADELPLDPDVMKFPPGASLAPDAPEPAAKLLAENEQDECDRYDMRDANDQEGTVWR